MEMALDCTAGLLPQQLPGLDQGWDHITLHHPMEFCCPRDLVHPGDAWVAVTHGCPSDVVWF